MKIWPRPLAKTGGNLQYYLRDLSGAIWREQKKAYDLGLNLREETITECLILQMARELPKANFRVRLFTRRREAETGADWVWFFLHGSCKIGFRVQAKKLYRSFGRGGAPKRGRYDALSGNISQSDDLINLAGPNNPIYLFFNHPEVADKHLFNLPSKTFIPPTFWGCSYADAHFVSKRRSGMLHKLFAGMRPLHELFAAGAGCPLKNGLQAVDPDLKVRLHEGMPEWFNHQDHREWLEDYLVRERLRGIAFFDATDVSEEYLDSK